MYNKAKDWWNAKGLKHIGLLIAAAILWFFFPGSFFNSIGFVLLGIAIGLNWGPIKDLSEADEWVVKTYHETKNDVNEKLEDVKKTLEEKIDDLKRELVGLKKK